jgi:glycosyltransferase involved in cell wall biosynthesis
MDLRIGFICGEYFNYTNNEKGIKPTNIHGGFGFLTKMKAEYLVKEGYDVHVFVPRESFYDNANGNVEINGVKVHTYKTDSLSSRPIRAIKGLMGVAHNKYFNAALREFRPDILQAEDTPPLDILRNTSMEIPFVLVFQDPFDYYDINLLMDSEKDYLEIPITGKVGYEMKDAEYHFQNKRIVKAIHKKNFVKPVHSFITKNRYLEVYAEAGFIAGKSKNLFFLPKMPNILHNPVNVYYAAGKKNENPTICWVARWDPQKRPDMALLIAKQLPEVNFIMIGTANRNSAHYEIVEEYLKKKFSALKNLKILGFVAEQDKREIIGKSWALLNTSIREGLPITFLEALAEGTPIISYVDPDQYVTNFGIKAESYTVKAFADAINSVIKNEGFKEIRSRSVPFIKKNHETAIVMSQHISIYDKMLSNNQSNAPLFAEMRK